MSSTDSTVVPPANSPPPIPPSLFVGIDVAKDKLDWATTADDTVATVPNDSAGVKVILKALATGPAIATVVIEATGGLEQPMLLALLDAAIPVALVNPGKVRQFAVGVGILAKTDAIDARVLARFGKLAEPRLAQRRSANQLELDALVTCRRQLTTVRAEQSNRRCSTSSKAALKALDAVIKTLDQQIEQLDAKIRKLIESDDDFKPDDLLLRSVPGVGPVLSSTLLAELRELGKVDRQNIGGIVGVVPYNRDSGKRSARRSIRGGRTAVRSVLYMATVAALRCNPVIQAFAQRLKAKGKLAKVVITACMRKLLTLLNAMLRERLRWDQLTVVLQTAPLGGGAK